VTTTDEAPAVQAEDAPEQEVAPQPGTAVARTTSGSIPEKIAYARALAASGLLPEVFRQQPANVLFALEYGDMIGLAPMAAITGINVIEGKPSASAGLISGLIRRAGHKLRVGYDAATMTGWATVIRSDDPGYTFRSEWNLDRAVTAELCTIKDGQPYAVDSKGRSKPWRKFFPSMVKARAITEVARDACEEVLFGLHYTPDELGAEVDEDGHVIAMPAGDAPAAAAGDPWETAAPAQAAPPAESADQKWVAWAIDRAASFETDDEGRGLWIEGGNRQRDGKISAADAKTIAGLIKARRADIKQRPADGVHDAEPVDGVVMVTLEPDDPWADKVNDLTDADEVAAAEAEVFEECKAGRMAEVRADLITAAIRSKAATFGQQVAA
jgi:hypothetical protein